MTSSIITRAPPTITPAITSTYRCLLPPLPSPHKQHPQTSKTRLLHHLRDFAELPQVRSPTPDLILVTTVPQRSREARQIHLQGSSTQVGALKGRVERGSQGLTHSFWLRLWKERGKEKEKGKIELEGIEKSMNEKNNRKNE